MPDHITLSVNDKELTVPQGTLLVTALAQAGITRFCRSVSGQPRMPLCGMGTCFECCVTINGRAHQRSCQILCRQGMEVRTDD
jgi:sarcosine oxidase subunit alpha